MRTSARPRTLVLVVSDLVIEVAMLGPRGHDLGVRQTVPLRQMSHGELHWSHVISGEGIELALTLAPRFGSVVYHSGIELPGLELGSQRVRKDRRVREYLSPHVLESKGLATWQKRVTRTIDELVAVWNPTTLFISAPPSLPMPELLPPAVVVPSRSSLEDALRVWASAEHTRFAQEIGERP
jgi:hypothetical protein